MHRRALGIDVGSVRVGVALADPLGMFASPLEVIDRRRVEPMARLAALVQLHAVDRVVVGHPLRLQGDAGPAVAAVQAFVAQLRPHLAEQVQIIAWDERLSTAQAQRAMIDQGVRRQQRRLGIDKVAAALILQSYLDASAQPAVGIRP